MMETFLAFIRAALNLADTEDVTVHHVPLWSHDRRVHYGYKLEVETPRGTIEVEVKFKPARVM